MNCFMEQLVADEHDEGEETQLKMAGKRIKAERSRLKWLQKKGKKDKQKTRFKRDTHYNLTGVFASLALMMKSGNRMEKRQPLITDNTHNSIYTQFYYNKYDKHV